MQRLAISRTHAAAGLELVRAFPFATRRSRWPRRDHVSHALAGWNEIGAHLIVRRFGAALRTSQWRGAQIVAATLATVGRSALVAASIRHEIPNGRKDHQAERQCPVRH